jgi:hypothetical protein
MRKPICVVRDVRTEIGLQTGNAGSVARDWTNPQVPLIHFVVCCRYPSLARRNCEQFDLQKWTLMEL